ncbi:ROK family transcriptional regulator [Paeniglutamicibacter psychrophenolicus]|uniref:NBD/HSP70 family sugar kinase n=1 Tax=Paeniglutamicibacter psychrophenolicus TaxID=257454 RepID=A0ABS4WI18_9MICC|nr:ROK family transcriptional regulator [Paeniglutamicibacter psychrophenolicus]MBP2375854.1 putative NBD/HSP70 family sugar kinase [Paeniglutamicibacter psychrophenolicus]
MQIREQDPGTGPRNGRGHRGDDLRRLNTAAVMKHVFGHPGLSRSEIAAQLGLSAASVTNITSILLDAGLLRALPSPIGAQGRPRVPLEIGTSALVLGIHLGPRTAGVVLMGLDGVGQASVLVPHAGMGPAETIDRVVAAAHKLVADHARGRPLLGTGIATGGIVDRHAAVIIDNPGAGWRNVRVMELLRGRLPSPVIVDNNARAAAQSELLYGHGQRTNDFVLMVITADIGSVMVDDGRIRAGFSQTAGQIAHLRVSDRPVPCSCGKTGCLAVMASDDAVAIEARGRGLAGVQNIDHVLELAGAQDPVAIEVLEQRNRYVGRAASQLIDIHDPELLVVAGTPAETPAVFAALVAEVARRAHAGSGAAGRVVLSSDHVFSLSLFAASTMVDAVLDDPLGHALPEGLLNP